MSVFKPDLYLKRFALLDVNELVKRNIRLLLVDFDNTIVPLGSPYIGAKEASKIWELKEQGIEVIILSNNKRSRVEPFARKLGVEFISFALKPFFHQYLRILTQKKCPVEQAAALGDQLFTDIIGANALGIYTIYCEPIGTKDRITTRVLRRIEEPFLKHERN
ncbi:MAG: YqeG family HAD IIIA-type phosphatase [Erysipelotrichaceae bacterium]|nr:YqeG family HAD IIIA-type phosphatase [Erysipelotrichaceae bacterium]